MKRKLSARFGETPNVSPISEPIAEKAEVEQEEIPTQTVPTRKKRNSQGDFKAIFFSRMELEDRQSLYVIRKVHERITAIVNEVGGRKSTVRSYVENIMLHHLETFKAEMRLQQPPPPQEFPKQYPKEDDVIENYIQQNYSSPFLSDFILLAFSGVTTFLPVLDSSCLRAVAATEPPSCATFALSAKV